MRRVGALILAAGGSTRFGEPKQFLRFEGESLLQRTINAAMTAACQPIAVVAGEAVEQIRDQVSGCEVVHNPDWQRGIGTSIRCGVAHLRGRADALVMLTCDQPFVTAQTLGSLIARHAPLVASSYANTIGVPAFFDARYFDALETLAEDSGAKAILEKHRAELATLDFPEAEIDIDTRADYDAIKSAGSFTFRKSSRSRG
jgi:molybdenum cofactor cytidylyltransferase